MSPDALLALSPLLILSGTAVAVLLGTALGRSHRLAAAGTAGGLALALAAVPAASSASPGRVTALLSLDRFAYFYMGLVLSAGLAVCLLSYGYLEERKEDREEFYVLLILATLGAAVLVAGSHLASFFLGLELLTVSLYALIAYPHGGDGRPVEAGLKYLVLAAASSSFLLFGMALVYSRFGEMEFARIGASVAAAGAFRDAWILLGTAMILTGAGFKLAVVPFHMWTPDVYEGAPAPVTAFVATVSKGAVFALLLRYFAASGAYGSGPAMKVVGLAAIASMIAGNLLALLQDNVKRMLAYSSIAHLGYLLVAFLGGGSLAGEAATFYLLAYFV
ncbi:MAG TPA: NADH-quinone oxidoreductase subunit N, partial [Longimicrobiales bacterium]|nr:NADH-quinone oxidoreductase subunit N [Longimicrobiales bacterium]